MQPGEADDPHRRSPPSEDPEATLARLRAEGVLRPATADPRDLPPPMPMTEALSAALGGRTLTEALLADREAERW